MNSSEISQKSATIKKRHKHGIKQNWSVLSLCFRKKNREKNCKKR